MRYINYAFEIAQNSRTKIKIKRRKMLDHLHEFVSIRDVTQCIWFESGVKGPGRGVDTIFQIYFNNFPTPLKPNLD